MTTKEYLIYTLIHTTIWLAFILTLCMIFDSAKPLWLLILYVLDQAYTIKK